MKQSHKIAAVFVGAAMLLGATGAVAAADPMRTQPMHAPAVTDQPNNGPDIPGAPDIPEPGDSPDAGD